MSKTTKIITDPEGTQYIIDSKTREILFSVDLEGYIYDKKGAKTGENIHHLEEPKKLF